MRYGGTARTPNQRLRSLKSHHADREATQAGAGEENACNEMGISLRTLQRWRSDTTPLEDQRSLAVHPTPRNKLSEEEIQRIITITNQLSYQSLPPIQIVLILADNGVYIASESSFYRVLRKRDMQHHRGRSKNPSRNLFQLIVPQSLTRFGCGISHGSQDQPKASISIYI